MICIATKFPRVLEMIIIAVDLAMSENTTKQADFKLLRLRNEGLIQETLALERALNKSALNRSYKCLDTRKTIFMTFPSRNVIEAKAIHAVVQNTSKKASGIKQAYLI